jgi:hypothetical protein
MPNSIIWNPALMSTICCFTRPDVLAKRNPEVPDVEAANRLSDAEFRAYAKSLADKLPEDGMKPLLPNNWAQAHPQYALQHRTKEAHRIANRKPDDHPKASILGDNRPSSNFTAPPSPHTAPAIIASQRSARAPRGFLRRHQARSEIATESRVPRPSRPRHDTSRQRHRAPSAPPRPTGRRVPPGTWVRRTLTLMLGTRGSAEEGRLFGKTLVADFFLFWPGCRWNSANITICW